ncbi:MAG: hypothetical protein L0Z73_02145 [Gammaproteobacteria bacterium]|nr:hypothetical protein [Gammaproteobacteria bacterium]
MKKLMLFVIFTASGVTQAQQIIFLEEKTAFCYSEKALASYLKFAQKRDLEGMNELALKGKCNFVPDGSVVLLKNYRMNTIGDTKVVEFEMDKQTVWTFNVLVQTANFNNL